MLASMRSIFILASVLGLATSACIAAPTPDVSLKAAEREKLEAFSSYFNALASKIQKAKKSVAGSCSLDNATMSVAPTPLPSPSGLVLKQVTIGRGTQNYTCATSDASSVPTQVGAVADLYDASCIASQYPDILNKMSAVALQVNLSTTSGKDKLSLTGLTRSGKHLFLNQTTPYFDLFSVGEAPCEKTMQSNAPSDAAVTMKTGAAAVPWLYLQTRTGATNNLHAVYRIQTAGGSAPATCAGQPTTIEVPYAAQYWFYESA